MAWAAAGSGARIALRDFLSQHARSAADPRDLWRLLGRRARADLQVNINLCISLIITRTYIVLIKLCN